MPSQAHYQTNGHLDEAGMNHDFLFTGTQIAL